MAILQLFLPGNLYGQVMTHRVIKRVDTFKRLSTCSNFILFILFVLCHWDMDLVTNELKHPPLCIEKQSLVLKAPGRPNSDLDFRAACLRGAQRMHRHWGGQMTQFPCHGNLENGVFLRRMFSMTQGMRSVLLMNDRRHWLLHSGFHKRDMPFTCICRCHSLFSLHYL